MKFISTLFKLFATVLAVSSLAMSAYAANLNDARNARDSFLAKLPMKGQAGAQAKLAAFVIQGFELGTAYGCDTDSNLTYWEGENADQYSILALLNERSDAIQTHVAAFCSKNRILEGDDPQGIRVANQLTDFNRMLNPHLYNSNGSLRNYDPNPAVTIPLAIYTHSTGGLMVVKMGKLPVNAFFVSNHASAVGGTEGASDLHMFNWDKDILYDLDKATDSVFGHQPVVRIDGRIVPSLFLGSVYEAGDAVSAGSEVSNYAGGLFINDPNDGVLPSHSTAGAKEQYDIDSPFCLGDCYRQKSQDYVYNNHKHWTETECSGWWWWETCTTVTKGHGKIDKAEIAFFNNKEGTNQGHNLGVQNTDMDHYAIHRVADALNISMKRIDTYAAQAGLY